MAALLPLFAASVLPAELRTLICRVTGAVMAVESGCPAALAAPAEAEAEGSETSSGRVSDLGCCVVETIDLGRLVAEHGADGAPPPAFNVVSGTPVVGVVWAARPGPTVRQDRPPPVGPPLLLVKRSFLI
jgi:hypothetical protein